MSLREISRRLCDRLDSLSFGEPVAYVYNPLSYAWEPHAAYLDRYGRGRKEAVFVGMNPGPWGMAQSGVPFGEIAAVRDWLGIDGKVGRPKKEHPRKPIEGFACRRSEVSGRRLWGLFADCFDGPGDFFERFFVLNYCPLLFMEESGRNLTPDRLPVASREPLLEICDQALAESVEALGAGLAIGIGNFAEKRLRQVLGDRAIRIGTVLHPSPASPAANRDWRGQALDQLARLGLNLTPRRRK